MKQPSLSRLASVRALVLLCLSAALLPATGGASQRRLLVLSIAAWH